MPAITVWLRASEGLSSDRSTRVFLNIRSNGNSRHPFYPSASIRIQKVEEFARSVVFVTLANHSASGNVQRSKQLRRATRNIVSHVVV